MWVSWLPVRTRYPSILNKMSRLYFFILEIGREWVREMAELTRKYQTKLEDVQARNKELRLELAEVQV